MEETFGNITLIQGDCMDFLRECPDKAFDLAIVDPPYGISINHNIGRRKGQKPTRHEKINWDDAVPPAEYFDELFRTSNNQIIWGGNYFPLPACRHFIFWDKQNPQGLSFSDGEMAWTSFDRAIRKFSFNNAIAGKIYPTQKPVALYKWLLKNYANIGDTILDTHLGSGSSAIAAHDGDFEFTGIELDTTYYAAARQRLIDHQAQGNLF